MNFAYSDEQKDIQGLARQILGDMCAPERLKKLEDQRALYDRELWRALAEAGLTGVPFAEPLGGMGFDFESLCILLEEAGRHVARVPILPVLVGACLPIQRFAGEKQQVKFLPDVISGKALITSARIEPGNENPMTPKTTATKTADAYTLRGNKHCVPVADEAGHIVLAAQSDDGLIVVAVEVDSPGVELQPQVVTSGETCFQVHLTDVTVPADCVLAEGDTAVAWLSYAEQHYQAALCAMAVGLCDKMMRMTASYTSEREQFGRPVATFQAVGHRMADCYKDVECLRLTTQQAVYQLQGTDDAEEAVTVAKIWCGDVCHRVSQAAQHCHGGIGVDRDYPLFRYCLMAREIELTAGSSARLLDRLGDTIARRALAG